MGYSDNVLLRGRFGNASTKLSEKISGLICSVGEGDWSWKGSVLLVSVTSSENALTWRMHV